jgi:hypothetical protein
MLCYACHHLSVASIEDPTKRRRGDPISTPRYSWASSTRPWGTMSWPRYSLTSGASARPPWRDTGTISPRSGGTVLLYADTDDVTHSGCIYCPTFVTILDLWHTLSHVITHIPSYLPTRMVLSLLHSSTCLSLPHANKQTKYCLEQHFTRYILIILLLSLLPLSVMPFCLSVVYLMYRQRTTTLQDSRVRWCRARDLSCHHDEWGAAWLQEHPVEGPPRSQVAHHHHHYYYYSVRVHSEVR